MSQKLRATRSIKMGLLSLALVVTATAGCASEEDTGVLLARDAPVSTDLALRDVANGDRLPLVRVLKGPDHLVSFYRGASGDVMITQFGRGTPTPVALPADPVAAFQQIAPGEPVPEALTQPASDVATQAAPVTVHAAPEALQKGAFPWTSFSCWARNPLNCLYNQTEMVSVGFPRGTAKHQYNVVWAVDEGSVHVALSFLLDTKKNEIVKYAWDTHQGEWRTLQFPNSIRSASFITLPFGPASFHFSDATGKQ